MSKVKVLLVEDHPLMRAGIRSLVMERGSFTIQAEAGTLEAARACLQRDKFDLVLLDLTLPDGFGLSLLTEIQNFQSPKIPVIILTMHNEEPYLAKAIKQGAAGYVVKDMAPERLVETMNRVIRGEKCFFISSQDEVVAGATPVSYEKMPVMKETSTKALSAREQKVMDMIIQGKSLTEIGDELSLSVKTIFTYRVRIFKKLGISSNADLVRLGYVRDLDSN